MRGAMSARPMNALTKRLAAGDVVILDGATGTELQRRGVPMHEEAWSAAALQTHPGDVRAVHEDYIRAGSDVIVTNTFGTNRALLERAGLADRMAELNLTAVQLARQARENAAGNGRVAIAGSINIWHRPTNERVTRADVAEQSALLAEGGVDLIALEMMESIGEAALAIEEASATGLPVWIGLSVKRSDDGDIVLLRDAEPVADAIDAWRSLGAAAYLVMHSLPDVTGPALALIRESWSGPLGAYAHMGEFTMPDWRWVNVLDPDAYAAHADEWVALGAQIVGGCCGLGPEYVSVLAERFAS